MILTILALVVRVGSLISSRHLGFDDGVYGASTNAMRHGGAPFRDVFSSQGPLFLPIVAAFDWIGAHWVDAPRLAAIAAPRGCSRRIARARPRSPNGPVPSPPNVDLGQHDTAADALAVAGDRAVLDANRVASLEQLEQIWRNRIDQGDPRFDDPQRALVRTPPGDRCRRVQHRADARRDQTFGGHPIDVGVVDHRNVAPVTVA